MFKSPFATPFVNAFPNTPFPGMAIPKNVIPSPNQGPRYLTFGADTGGCFFYRAGWANTHLNMSGSGDHTSLTKMILDAGWYKGFKTIKLQRQASSEQKQFIQFLQSIQKECGFKLMYEVDDVVFHEEIPDYNVYKEAFATNEIRQNCIDMINMVDEVTVTCKYMRDLYIEKTGKKEISVVPNFPPEWWIGNCYDKNKVINNYDKNKKKPRIVYSGSGAHFDAKGLGIRDDFSHVLKFIIDNRTKYQFVFIGAFPPPLKPFVDSGEIEFHPWQTLMNYPKFLASLNPQLFIAPLLDIPFNRSKSDIKYIESAIMGVPCMCQDMVTYEDAPDFLKFNDSEDLTEKVDKILNWKNRSKYYQLVPALRSLGESRFLERPENIGCFTEAIDTPFNDPSRRFMRQWN